MNAFDIFKTIKNKTAIEFKIFNSMEELDESAFFPFKAVVHDNRIEHLKIIKKVDVLAEFFYNELKNLTYKLGLVLLIFKNV